MAQLTTTKLVKRLAAKNRRSQKHYQEALQEILQGIQEQVAQGNNVQLIGFGTFYTRTHKGGKVRNPRTGNEVEYGSFKQVDFRPGAVLKSAVKGRQPEHLRKAREKRTSRGR